MKLLSDEAMFAALALAVASVFSPVFAQGLHGILERNVRQLRDTPVLVKTG